MYAGGRDMFGSGWHQLHVLDHLISELTKPSLPEATLAESVSAQLRALGLALDRSPRREELVAELWGRKRPLLRQLDAFDDPMPPCA
jgi:hypothetical protein